MACQRRNSAPLRCELTKSQLPICGAVLRCQERTTVSSNLKSSRKERPQYSCNSYKRVKARMLASTEKSFSQNICAGPRTVYESPAQIGFQRLQLCLQLRLLVLSATRSVVRLCRRLHRSLRWRGRLLSVRFLGRRVDRHYHPLDVDWATFPAPTCASAQARLRRMRRLTLARPCRSDRRSVSSPSSSPTSFSSSSGVVAIWRFIGVPKR